MGKGTLRNFFGITLQKRERGTEGNILASSKSTMLDKHRLALRCTLSNADLKSKYLMTQPFVKL